MTIIGIVSARHRNWGEAVNDLPLVEKILESLQEAHGDKLWVCSIGNNNGVGRIIKQICIRENVPFVEHAVHFFIPPTVENVPLGRFYNSRHHSLLSLTQEVHVLRSRKSSDIDTLIENAAMMGVPCIIYEEKKGDQDGEAESEEGSILREKDSR